MSSTTAQTQYDISINLGNADATVQLNLTTNQTADFQDAEAFALLAALVAAFPAAWNVGPYTNIAKAVLDDTYYQGDTSVSPPVFQ